MVYHGTEVTETILVGPSNDYEEVHFVALTKSENDPVFYVTSCCDPDWVWVFNMNNTSSYEMIKYAIMNEAFECRNIEELIEKLDEVFEEDFIDMAVIDDECCGNCENCVCKNER